MKAMEPVDDLLEAQTGEADAGAHLEGGPHALRQVLVSLKEQLWRSSLSERQAHVERLLQSANSLLDRGHCLIDLPGRPMELGCGHPFHSGLSLLSEDWRVLENPWVEAPMKALAARLHAHGGRLDLLCGYEYVPLVVHALRYRNRPFALQLVEMGAPIDEDSLRRPKMGQFGAVLSVLDEAEAALGTQARAEMAYAVMRRELALSAAAAPDEARSRPAPRRVRV